MHLSGWNPGPSIACTYYVILLNCCIMLLIALYLLSLVHGVQPDMTRDGCSIPVTLALQNAMQKNIVLLPIGVCDDGAHSQNEKINIVNYVQGVGFARLLLVKKNFNNACACWKSQRRDSVLTHQLRQMFAVALILFNSCNARRFPNC